MDLLLRYGLAKLFVLYLTYKFANDNMKILFTNV